MIAAVFVLVAPAYVPAHVLTMPTSRSAVLRRPASLMMAELSVKGNGVTVTDAMNEYAEGKLAKVLDRYGELLNGAVDVQLKVERRSLHDSEHVGKEAHIAEITARCTDKSVVHASAESESMYASLDELTDMVTRKLRKHKEKVMDVKQNRRRDDKKGVVEALVQDEDDDA